jgi:(S)-2-hydroxyglutarate dehydrogenase
MLRPERRHLVRKLIRPFLDPSSSFLAIHFVPSTSGEVEAGPDVVLALSGYGYGRRDISVRGAADAIGNPGFWRFLGRRAAMSGDATRRSKRLCCQPFPGLVPDVRQEDLIPGRVGNRAQTMTLDGELIQHFLIIRDTSSVHILNATSPGATAALAICDEIVELIGAN